MCSPPASARAPFANVRLKALKNQKSCRNSALELVEQFESFLMVEAHIPELRERSETKRAVSEMLKVITEAVKFISDDTPTGRFSAYRGW